VGALKRGGWPAPIPRLRARAAALQRAHAGDSGPRGSSLRAL